MGRAVIPWGGWSALRKAELIDEIADTLYVPVQAVFREGTTNVSFVVDGGDVERREIEGGGLYAEDGVITKVGQSGQLPENADTVIDATATGYEGGDTAAGNAYGPGGGAAYSGGGYGGQGGNYSSYAGGATYGSSNAPVDPGSGGCGHGNIGGFGGGLTWGTGIFRW